MTYFYAVLGILMMSGIVAIFNMSLKITSQPLQAVIPENDYQKNKFDINDKLFLELLQDSDKSWGSGEEFCEKILSEINNSSKDFSALTNYTKTIPPPSRNLNQRILGACSYNKSNHRILIKSRNLDNDSFYFSSCFVKQDKKYCDFEEIKEEL